jgi:uncharacterized protein YjiS (DUF1127 family)
MSMSFNSFALDARAIRFRTVDLSNAFAGFRSQVSRALNEMRQARRLRQSMAALERLDNRTLKDIGFDRSEIASVVLNPDGERTR